jgi:hypothetical protein
MPAGATLGVAEVALLALALPQVFIVVAGYMVDSFSGPRCERQAGWSRRA